MIWMGYTSATLWDRGVSETAGFTLKTWPMAHGQWIGRKVTELLFEDTVIHTTIDSQPRKYGKHKNVWNDHKKNTYQLRILASSQHILSIKYELTRMKTPVIRRQTLWFANWTWLRHRHDDAGGGGLVVIFMKSMMFAVWLNVPCGKIVYLMYPKKLSLSVVWWLVSSEWEISYL